jgi:hypothetical protein
MLVDTPPPPPHTQANAALEIGNWFRFFSLVRSGSYLQACLLHSKFLYMRAEALRRLAQAFTGPYPLAKVQQALACEDLEEAWSLCEALQLQVKQLPGSRAPVVMFPGKLHEVSIEDTTRFVRKSIVVIEAKVMLS